MGITCSVVVRFFRGTHINGNRNFALSTDIASPKHMIFLLQEDMCMQPKEALFKRFCFLAVQICLNLLLAKLKKLYDIEDLA